MFAAPLTSVKLEEPQLSFSRRNLPYDPPQAANSDPLRSFIEDGLDSTYRRVKKTQCPASAALDRRCIRGVWGASRSRGRRHLPRNERNAPNASACILGTAGTARAPRSCAP